MENPGKLSGNVEIAIKGKWKIVENRDKSHSIGRKNYALSVSFSRYCIKIEFILIKSVHLLKKVGSLILILAYNDKMYEKKFLHFSDELIDLTMKPVSKIRFSMNMLFYEMQYLF